MIFTRECKPGGIFQTRVYGFEGLQTQVPGNPGLIMSVRRAAHSYCSVGLHYSSSLSGCYTQNFIRH